MEAWPDYDLSNLNKFANSYPDPNHNAHPNPNHNPNPKKAKPFLCINRSNIG